MALPLPFMTSGPASSTKLERFQVSPSSPAERIRCSSFAAQTRNIHIDRKQSIGIELLGREEIEEILLKTRVTDQQDSTGLRIAYQGVAGAYSEAAAKLACIDCVPIPCRSIAAAVGAVENGKADHAIVPVESTMEGNKVRNYELLLEKGLYITQEINLFVHYCLLAIPGVKKRHVKKVMSHPLALAHCSQGLARLGLSASQEAVDDTAGAVEMLLSQNMLDTAAIASPRAADLYRLQVLAQGLQDESWNVTRFLIVSNSQTKVKKKNTPKTSMVITHQGGLQPLLRVLSAFSSRNINLAKLEVKNFTAEPVRILDVRDGSTKAFQHVFYVDFEGTIDDPKVKDAVAEISSFSTFTRTLGCYASDSKIYDLH
ncbi:arogenate dehydratase 1-like [Nymphaea colorata]|nr:arogenate dehydratase 1-like [Nymphaea colorata]